MNTKAVFAVVQLLLVFQLISGCKKTENSVKSTFQSVEKRADTLPKNVVRSIEKRIEVGINSAISVAIINENGAEFFNYGKAHANGRAVDEHTVYEIGSITKVFTSLILGVLVSKDEVFLEDKVYKYFPSKKGIPKGNFNNITLGSLSDHTSGLPRMPPEFKPSNPNNPYLDFSFKELSHYISAAKISEKVGSKYLYSNLGYAILGYALSSHTNLTYEELLTSFITEPLDMSETRVTLDSEMSNNFAKGHRFGSEVNNWDMSAMISAGGIFSSTSDLAKFIYSYLGYSNIDLQNSMELTIMPRHNMAHNRQVGLGWHIASKGNRCLVIHGGLTGGYSSFIGFIPESGKGVVVLSNSDSSIDDIGFHLLNPQYDLREVKSPKESISLSNNVLESYVGTYSWPPYNKIIVSLEQGVLYAKINNFSKIQLYAKTSTEFYTTTSLAEFRFQIIEASDQKLFFRMQGKDVMFNKTN